MRFLVILLAIGFGPSPLWAACGGTDVIAQMSEETRARLDDNARATPNPEGLLWKAERGETTITLFGTYHFKHDRTQAHLDSLIPIIDDVDAIYLEVSNDDQDKLQREMALDPSIMFITEGETLIDLLGEDDWQTYKAAMEERAIPGFMAAKFKPMWAAILLGVGPCETRAGALEGGGIDERIGTYAAEIGNPSQSLEDYRLLLTMMDMFPQEDQLDMIRLFFAWAGDADDMAYTLRQRYLAEETAIIWEFSKEISLQYGGETAEEDFALMEEMMLTNRNTDWITRLMDQAIGKDVFIAVGAAHLPGDNGVLNLLAQEGFTITRQDFEP